MSIYRAPYMYGLQCGEFIKIGVANTVGARVKLLQLGNPYPMKVVIREKSIYAYVLEKMVHTRLAEKSIGREWFAVTIPEARQAVREAKGDLKERLDQQKEWEDQAILKLATRGLDVD